MDQVRSRQKSVEKTQSHLGRADEKKKNVSEGEEGEEIKKIATARPGKSGRGKKKREESMISIRNKGFPPSAKFIARMLGQELNIAREGREQTTETSNVS